MIAYPDATVRTNNPCQASFVFGFCNGLIWSNLGEEKRIFGFCPTCANIATQKALGLAHLIGKHALATM